MSQDDLVIRFLKKKKELGGQLDTEEELILKKWGTKMQTKTINFPAIKTEIELLPCLTLYRRLREHGTRSEQFLIQLPTDLLNPSTDINTPKKFKIQLGRTKTGKRIIVVNLDEFIFPNETKNEVVFNGKI